MVDITKYGKYLFSLLVLVNLLAVVAAGDEGTVAGAETSIAQGLCSIIQIVNYLLIGVMFVMIVGAAVVYAGGQIMGAETRARASVWATAMFTGAIIGAVIYMIVPVFINAVMGVNPTKACTAGANDMQNVGTGDA